MTTLNFVVDYLYKNGYTFIIHLDWKQEVTPLSYKVLKSLLKNFGVSIELSKQEQYGKRAPISTNNVFTDFDLALKNHGFQMSFIDTGGDEYMIIVHKTDDLNAVRKAIKEIGYGYRSTPIN